MVGVVVGVVVLDVTILGVAVVNGVYCSECSDPYPVYFYSHPNGDHSAHVVEVPLYPCKDISYGMNVATFIAQPGRYSRTH